MSGRKVVLNALQYKNNSSGIGMMVRDLFGTFSRLTDADVEVLLMRDAPDFPCGAGTRQIRINCNCNEGIKRVLFRNFMLGSYAEDSILITTDSLVPFFLPKSARAIPLVTDLALYHMPEVYSSSRVMLWKLQYSIPFKKAYRYMAVSEFTRRDMTDVLGIPGDKIDVVYDGVSEIFRRVDDKARLAEIREKYSLGEHYILFVGSNNPRKNLKRTIQGFELAKEAGIPHRLVIAGDQGWKFDRAEAMKSISHKDDISFIGYVPDEDMPALYTAADMFVFPTLYEGFGMPVIEAQRCGTPVLTSNVTALPEVAGNAAVYVDPYSVEEIADAMKRLAADSVLSAELTARGYENARRFSWESSARKLDEIIKAVPL